MRNCYSYSKKLEDFIPQRREEVRMYTCGPTVYRKAHIGNLRVYVFSDIVSRTLKFFGYRVLNVMNITDIGHLAGDGDEGEDKVELAAKELGKSASELAQFYTDHFLQSLKELNVNLPYKITKATDYISEQIFLIRVLEDKGYTYKLDDGIYFNVSRFPKYFDSLIGFVNYSLIPVFEIISQEQQFNGGGKSNKGHGRSLQCCSRRGKE